MWDIATGSCRSVCAHGDSVVSLRWHDSLPIVCTAALDHIVRIWDARSGKPCIFIFSSHMIITTYTCKMQCGDIGCLCQSQLPSMLLSDTSFFAHYSYLISSIIFHTSFHCLYGFRNSFIESNGSSRPCDKHRIEIFAC